MFAARSLYTALVYTALPLAVARLAWRARREPGYREHMGERFGRYAPAPAAAQPLLWIHAVSVGETRAAEPLVHALRRRYPDHRILLTHMTPAGRRTGEALFGERVLSAYVPYDYPAAIDRFLDRYRPRAGILLETEVWPNLVQGCRRRGVPLFLVNARLSEKSLRGYLRVRRLARQSFGALRAVAAQTDDDARRLRCLGAEDVVVSGNLKFDMTPDPGLFARGRSWRTSYGARPVLVAASTREGEEAMLIGALPQLPDDVLLVIVPRHPHRFDEVATLLARAGIAFQRRSAGDAVRPATRVLLGDSMGEMVAYYAAADAAFIGGSLLPYGGQNLIEACAVGTPVLVGPHTYNFADASAKAIDAGAALRVRDVADLVQTALALLGDDGRRETMSARARAFSRAHQGATERVMQILAPALEVTGGTPRTTHAR